MYDVSWKWYCISFLMVFAFYFNVFRSWFQLDYYLVILCLLILIYCSLLWVDMKLSFSEKSDVWSNNKLVFDLLMNSANCLNLSISNLMILSLAPSSLRNHFLSFTFFLSTPPKKAFIWLILFLISQISFIRESFKAYKSASYKDIDSGSKIEEEVVFSFFISGVWMSFNFFIFNVEVSVQFNIGGGSNKVWSGDIWITSSIFRKNENLGEFFHFSMYSVW